MRRAAAAPSLRRAAPPPCSAASLRRRFATRAEPSQSVSTTPLTLAVPPFARAADGAALASQGSTSVLATVVANRLEPRWHRELNLIVDYREPNAGHGRIPSNATKRDGAPLLKEMQNAALIEECMAAAFPDTYLCETQLNVSVLAQEAAHDPLVPALNAAALAYRMAPFPFKHQPWAAARCVIDEAGRVHTNPPSHTVRGAAGSLVIAATKSKIVWMEATASAGRTLPEKVLEKVIKAGLEAVHSMLAAQDKIAAAAPPAHPLSAKLIEPSKEVLDAAALIAGDGYKEIALLPRRAMFEGMSKLNQSLVASLRNRFFRLQDYDADLACEALQSKAARWAVLEAGARADGRLPAEARPLAADVEALPNAPHVRAMLLSIGDTRVLAQHASGVARDRESDLDAHGSPKRLYVQVTEPPYASTMVGRHSKKVEQNEAQLSSLVERVVSPSVTLRHPNALSRVAITLLDADGSHLPAYVMATSLALARQGQLAEPFASLQVAVYEGGNGVDGAVLCDPTALESRYADSQLHFTTTGAGLVQLRVSSHVGLDAARLPALQAQAKPALQHLHAALKGLAPRPAAATAAVAAPEPAQRIERHAARLFDKKKATN